MGTKFKSITLIVTIAIIGISSSFFQTFFSGFSRVQTGHDECIGSNQYVLEHSYLWLIRDPSHLNFWNPPFFYPVQNTLAFGEVYLSSAPFYWIFRGLGFEFFTAFQLWSLSIFIMNYIVVTYSLLQLSFSVFASVAAGYLFSFANMRVAQLGHTQVLPQFFTVLTFLSVYQIFKFHSWKKSASTGFWIFVLVFMTVCQFYSGFYLGWFNVFGLFLIGCISLFHTRLRQELLEMIRKNRESIFIASILGILLLLPLLIHYWRASQESGLRSLAEVKELLPRLRSWFYLGAENWVYGAFQRSSFYQGLEFPDANKLSFGFFTSTFAILGLFYSRKNILSKLSWKLWLCIVTLSTYMGQIFWGHQLWELIYYFFPAAGAVRGVCLIGFLCLIPASIGVAFFFERFKTRKLVLATLFVIMALEQVHITPTLDKKQERERLEGISALIPDSCKSFVYTVFSRKEDPGKVQVDAMLVSLIKDIPTLNGRSGIFPRQWPLLYVTVPGSERQFEEALSSWSDYQKFNFDLKCWVKL